VGTVAVDAKIKELIATVIGVAIMMHAGRPPSTEPVPRPRSSVDVTGNGQVSQRFY